MDSELAPNSDLGHGLSVKRSGKIAVLLEQMKRWRRNLIRIASRPADRKLGRV